MSICKNIDCNEPTVSSRVYCSLKCRNEYVNKYLRDYSVLRVPSKQRVEYENSPKLCKFCNSKIPYDKKRNKYCNSSCSLRDNPPLLNKSKEEIKSIYGRVSKSLIKDVEDTYCPVCSGLKKFRNKYCSSEDCRKNRLKSIDSTHDYRVRCRFSFSLNNYPDKFNFKLIEKFGWYKAKNRGDNPGGVSRDHMFSVNSGFILGVDPDIIKHPANCKLIRQCDNASKHTKNSIGFRELLDRIDKWDKNFASIV